MHNDLNLSVHNLSHYSLSHFTIGSSCVPAHPKVAPHAGVSSDNKGNAKKRKTSDVSNISFHPTKTNVEGKVAIFK